MKRLVLATILTVLIGSLCGCETTKVNLFEPDDHISTKAGDVVAGITTKYDGKWFRNEALNKLVEVEFQKAGD